MTELKWEDRDEGRWIHLEGELDHDGCAELSTPFVEATSSGPDTIVVDMAAVTFCASQGLRMLLQAHQNLKNDGRTLHVHGLRPHVRKVFETTGLFHAIPEWGK